MQPSPFQSVVRAFVARDWPQAEHLCRQLVEAQPRHADALQLLGLVLGETGRFDEAIAALQAALDVRPGSATMWANLGIVYRKAGKNEDSVASLRRAIELDKNFAEAQFCLGLAYQNLNLPEAAIESLRRAIVLRPEYAAAHYNLGILLRDEGQIDEAVREYQVALRLHPQWPDAHLNLAAAWLDLNQPARAVEHYHEVLRLQPGRGDAELSLAHALRALGRAGEAEAAYARAAASEGKQHGGDALGVLSRETVAEVIPMDGAAIERYRQRVSAALSAFAAQPGEIALDQVDTQGAFPSSMLAYYGGDARPLMEQYAAAIGPKLPREPLTPRTGKPKLGIVVTDRHEGVFARCWGGIAQRLSRERFDVRIICSRRGANYLRSVLEIPPHEYLTIPKSLNDIARLLREQEFDWLHYWEIGTDSINYYLPFLRVAPGQSTCWGWPITSGNPDVNAYLSCAQLEPEGAQAHYTEQLILFEHLPTYYTRPPALLRTAAKSDFGLSNTERVYLCTQNLRKFHIDFDPILAKLLRSDAQGTLVIIGDTEPFITERLMERFRRTMPDVVSRVRMLPRMEHAEYLGLVAVADVMLDTLHYGGGANTVYDAVAVGTPIVTLPGEFHRGRWTAAVNRRLGVEQLIAQSPEEYVAAAIRVAQDVNLRASLGTRILAAGAELFEDSAVIREHDDYFSQAIEEGVRCKA